MSLHALPTRGAEVLLTKQQLAAAIDRSPRWIEMRVREGMPSEDPTRRFPHRRFRLSAVQAWLAAGERQAPIDRVGRLEAEVARLAAIVEQLERKAG